MLWFCVVCRRIHPWFSLERTVMVMVMLFEPSVFFWL